MQTLVNTDSNFTADTDLTALVKSIVDASLEHHADRITRVEVHFTDENSDKKGGDDDIRCLMEARVAGLQPVVASHRAGTVEEAADGAAQKLQRAVGSTLGKLDEH
jgi:hypothetical protein